MSTMRIHQRGRPPYPGILTPAEQHVLEYVREGLTNVEIAYRLGISPDGVKYHISNMLGKLELADRKALAAWRPSREHTGWVRRLRGWLPVAAFPKVVGMVFGGAALVAGGAGVITAFAMMGGTQPDVATNATATPPPSAPRMTVNVVKADDIETVLKITLPLGPEGATSNVSINPAQITVTPDKGVLDLKAWPGRTIRGVTPSSDGASVDVDYEVGPTPSEATALTVDVAKLTIGSHSDGPWHAVVPITPTHSRDLTGLLPQTTYDTGYGWSYVIDSVRGDETAVVASFHIEGDAAAIEGLTLDPFQGGRHSPTDPTGQWLISSHMTSPTTGEITLHGPADSTLSSVDVPLPDASVRSDDTVTTTFEKVGGSWQGGAVTVGGQQGQARVIKDSTMDSLAAAARGVFGSHTGEQQFSIAIDSPVFATSTDFYERVGVHATLTDDVGTAYEPYSMGSSDSVSYAPQGSNPPPGYRWDFGGSIAPAATTLPLTFPDLPQIEVVNQSVTIPLDK